MYEGIKLTVQIFTTMFAVIMAISSFGSGDGRWDDAIRALFIIAVLTFLL
jgi:hypothetical protein